MRSAGRACGGGDPNPGTPVLLSSAAQGDHVMAHRGRVHMTNQDVVQNRSAERTAVQFHRQTHETADACATRERTLEKFGERAAIRRTEPAHAVRGIRIDADDRLDPRTMSCLEKRAVAADGKHEIKTARRRDFTPRNCTDSDLLFLQESTDSLQRLVMHMMRTLKMRQLRISRTVKPRERRMTVFSEMDIVSAFFIDEEDVLNAHQSCLPSLSSDGSIDPNGYPGMSAECVERIP